MFTELLNDDDRGVSPVIGVILMVAITVILAAVIGAFVLNLGDSVATDQPQASFDFEFDGNKSVEITHQGGDNIETDQIRVTVAGTEAWPSSEGDAGVSGTAGWSGDAVRTGDILNVTNTTTAGDPIGDQGDTIRVIWTGDDGSGATLASQEIPN